MRFESREGPRGSETQSRNRRINRRQVLLGIAAAAAGYGLYHAARRLFTPRPGSELAAESVQVPTRIYGDDTHPVAYRRPLTLDSPPARYTGFKPGTTLLKAGTVRRRGARALTCDIVFERDVPVTLRDGTVIYTDVFRPTGAGRHPAIIAWSPYGKEIGGQWLDDVPFRANVPLSAVSELQKFEGPDPALYVDRGYVVLNPDARGAYRSGGNINFWGRQNAEDGYDFVEWAAMQSWCSGKTAFAGNSWLAMSQWFIAAERPPHLCAIAPWEGASSKYLEGGIPVVTFDEVIVQSFAGNQLVEDLPRMMVTHPLMDAYWEDKAARLENIDVPAYVVASYTNQAHTQGTFAGFRRISSPQKWLRVHNTQEWQDFHHPEHAEDLLKFFDHFLKGADNGWESTPRVRLAVLNPGGIDILDRPESQWPLARQRFERLYLHGDETLSPRPAAQAAAVSYAADGGSARFIFAFDRDTEVTGYMSLRVWLEAQGSDDMDVVVAVEKLDSKGRSIGSASAFPPGGHIATTTMLRVSHRALDPHRSTPSEPHQSHRIEELLQPGDIVPVEFGLWPMALLYRAGEQLRVTLTAFQGGSKFPLEFGTAKVPVPADGGTFAPGSHPELVELGGPLWTKPAYVARQSVPAPPTRNRGTHVVHLGGRYDSVLTIPVIPAAAGA